MAVNPFDIVSYLEEARSRTTEQFKYDPTDNSGAVIFDKYLQLLIAGSTELQEVFRQLMQERSLDTAVGAQLDIIGEIVGQPRELIDTALIDYFAYLGYPNAQSFGDLNIGSLGGVYYSLGDPLAGNTLLNDDQYRLFIKAKIIKNNTNVTPNQYLDFLAFVFGVDTNSITETGNASFTVLIGKELSSFERVLLTYVSYANGYPSRFIPKPIGVKVNYGQFDFNDYFGFAGAPNAKGYGTLVGSDSGYGIGYGTSYGSSNFTIEGGGKYATLF